MRRLIRIILTPWFLLMAMIAAVVTFIAIATAILVFVSAVAAAIVAYAKREEWTLPAFRWARDRTGQWSVTPWSAQSSVTPADPAEAGPQAT